MESNIEVLKKAEVLFHQLLTINLTIRTLEIDIQKLSNLKISKPLIKWYEKEIDNLMREFKDKKRQLNNMGAKSDLQPKQDGDLQVYLLIVRGSTYTYKYFKIRLKNIVENEISKRLGVEYVDEQYNKD